MMQFIKKHWKIISVFAVVTVIGVPLLIHILFKQNASGDFFVAAWTAGDVLAFYGVLLGSMATITGVYISITAANANYREDIIKRSLPFMTITALHRNTAFIFDEEKEQAKPMEEDYQEYVLQKIFFVIKHGVVTIQKELNDEQEKLVKNGGFIKESFGNGGQYFRATKSIYMPLEVENVGNGAATVFSVGFNSLTLAPEKWKFSLARNLKVGEKYQIGIFCDDCDEKSCGEYQLCVSYYDILGNDYEQNFICSVCEEKRKGINVEFRMDGTQQQQKNTVTE